jgi:hypothetical protein
MTALGIRASRTFVILGIGSLFADFVNVALTIRALVKLAGGPVDADERRGSVS